MLSKSGSLISEDHPSYVKSDGRLDMELLMKRFEDPNKNIFLVMIMPRFMDMHCASCGYQDEVQKDFLVFKDPETGSACPSCGKSFFFEKPSSVHLRVTREGVLRQRTTHSLSGSLIPQEVRALLSHELFDPCSCGAHAPGDLKDHIPDGKSPESSFKPPVN